MSLITNKYFVCAIMGFMVKLYDDLDELFFYKNKIVMECVKSFFIIITCYYLFVVSTNKYDILWVLFLCGFVPLFDLYAFTGEPYFFSVTLLFTLTCLYLIFFNGYTYNLSYFVLSFFIYSICSPITEIFCFDLNGPIFELLKILNIIDDKKINNFSGLSKTELEVSEKKIFIRIRSIIFLTIVIGILYYFIQNTNNIELQELFLSAIQYSIFNIFNLLLSVIHQCYVVYFNNSFIEIHKKINKEDEEIKDEDKKLKIKKLKIE